MFYFKPSFRLFVCLFVYLSVLFLFLFCFVVFFFFVFFFFFGRGGCRVNKTIFFLQKTSFFLTHKYVLFSNHEKYLTHAPSSVWKNYCVFSYLVLLLFLCVCGFFCGFFFLCFLVVFFLAGGGKFRFVLFIVGFLFFVLIFFPFYFLLLWILFLKLTAVFCFSFFFFFKSTVLD